MKKKIRNNLTMFLMGTILFSPFLSSCSTSRRVYRSEFYIVTLEKKTESGALFVCKETEKNKCSSRYDVGQKLLITTPEKAIELWEALR